LQRTKDNYRSLKLGENNCSEAFVGVDFDVVFLHIFAVVVIVGSFDVLFEKVSCEKEEENRLAV
jgi:hypothetical protein